MQWVCDYRLVMETGLTANASGFRRVGVVGSGIMGAGVAEVVASAGFDVTLVSRSKERAQQTHDALVSSLSRQVEKGRLTLDEREATLSRFVTSSDMADLGACDLIIESVVENLETKREVFGILDQVCAPQAILSTNTSTLPVVELAMRTQRPQLVCGVHFFNPAPVMALVEIVNQITAAPSTIERCIAFAHECRKEPVVVKDRAGFIVNALLFPYLNNAVRLLENGVASRDDMDKAMKGGCGFPMGPFALLDLVGIDTSVAILEALFDETRDPHVSPQPLLRRMVTANMLGRKSGVGFYDYPKRA
jgi:3-hydroxybutyryl-CoA dehydrogenase